MGLLIICFAVTNPIPLHSKIVKTKVWDFIFLPPPKHHCEAQINQIRIKGYPYYLYFDEFLNIFTISATPYYVRIMTYAVGLCKKWVVST